MSSQSVHWLFIIAVCYVHTTLAVIKVDWVLTGPKARHQIVITGIPPALNEIKLDENEHIYLGKAGPTKRYHDFTIGAMNCDAAPKCVTDAGRGPISLLELQTELNAGLGAGGISHPDHYWPMRFGNDDWLDANYELIRDAWGNFIFSDLQTHGAKYGELEGQIGQGLHGMGAKQKVESNQRAEGQESGEPLMKRSDTLSEEGTGTKKHGGRKVLLPYDPRNEAISASGQKEEPVAGGVGGGSSTFDPRLEPHKRPKKQTVTTGGTTAHVVYFNMDDLENLDEDYRDPMYQNAAVYGDDVVDYGWFHMLSWIGFNLLLWMIIGASCFCGGVACAVFVYSFYYWMRKVQKRNSLSLNDIEQMA